MSEERRRIDKAARDAALDMMRSFSDTGLQTAIELMLTDRPAVDVVAALRAWADYLDERR